MRRLKNGGDIFKVEIKGPSSFFEGQIVDNNDGTYTVTYTATQEGKHTIHVTLHEKNISNSPKTIPVSRSPPDALKCVAYGPGLEGGTTFETAEFTVEARNRFGERLKDGGDPIGVKVKGPYNNDVESQLKDNRNGTYSASYFPTDVGNHIVQVTLKDVQIADSPFHVMINRSSSDADPRSCIAYGPGLEGGTTAEDGIFTVECRNVSGDRIYVSGLPIDVEICDPHNAEIPVKLQDNNDGSFGVTYTPQQAGKHTVHVILRNKKFPIYFDHIKDSPFIVPIEAGTDAGNSIAYGPGLEDGITDTLPTHFTIQAKDKDGKNMPGGGDPFEVKIQGPKGPVDSQIKDNEDGTYTVNYQPVDPGKHKIDVTLKKIPIKDAPFSVLVKEGADEGHSCIENFTFTIRAKTKRGENRKDGNDKFVVTITGNSGDVPTTFKDIGDGTYLVSYKLPEPGDYTVHVKLNDKYIQGCPWTQHIGS